MRWDGSGDDGISTLNWRSDGAPSATSYELDVARAHEHIDRRHGDLEEIRDCEYILR
jgi:hypothetical protein